MQRLYCGVGAAVTQLLQRVHAVLEVAHEARVLHLAHLGGLKVGVRDRARVRG